MKLIIDIPYEAYYTFKCELGKGNLNALAEIVANGTPYNPSGDAISREALKEQINATDFDFGDYYDNTEEIRKRVCEVIDNAPTVEAYTPEQVKDLVDLNKKLSEERPRGEWINREAISNTIFPFWERYECNQCHKFNGYSNFCPNCGADMRGNK